MSTFYETSPLLKTPSKPKTNFLVKSIIFGVFAILFCVVLLVCFTLSLLYLSSPGYQECNESKPCINIGNYTRSCRSNKCEYSCEIAQDCPFPYTFCVSGFCENRSCDVLGCALKKQICDYEKLECVQCIRSLDCLMRPLTPIFCYNRTCVSQCHYDSDCHLVGKKRCDCKGHCVEPLE